MLRFRLRTLQLVVAIAAAPLWVLGAGVRYGCPDRVMLVWGILVVVPLFLMGLALFCARREPVRQQLLPLFGAIVIVGYAMAIPASLLAIGVLVP